MDTFARVIRHHAGTRPDAPALTFGAVTLSFGQLQAVSARLAQVLIGQGVRAGDRFGVLSRNRTEYFLAIIAASQIGATLVGLNWRLSAREIGEVVADADLTLILADDSGAALLAHAATPAPVLVFGPAFDAMLATAPAVDPAHPGQPGDVALILYTSGTTGRPKGAMLTNRGLSYTRALGQAWGMGPDSVNLVAMPMFHIGGCGYGSSTMLVGGHTVLMAEVSVPDILRLIPAHRVTNTFLVPSVVQMLLNAPEVAGADLSSLSTLMYGAAPLGDVLLRRAMAVLGCGFIHAYGMTECSGTVVNLDPDSHVLDGPRAALLASCGRVLPWVELRIVDPATGADLPAGGIGKLWIRTPMVIAGYWRNPAATAEAITPDGWFRSGDAARMDGEGHVFLIDRFKDMVISGGENIYPAEIENVLNGHPAVAQVGAIGVPHAKWGETPLAAAARAFCAPDYALPIGDVVFAGRDDAWLLAVDTQFRAWPGMGMTVHATLNGGDRAAVWFSEHGQSQGGRAVWSGVAIYRAAGGWLTGCVAQEDYFTRRRQVKSGLCDPIDPPCAAPWDQAPGQPDGTAEAAVLDWLEGDWPRPDVVTDDEHLTGAPLTFTVRGLLRCEVFSVGDRVAFHARLGGTYRDGLGLPGPVPAFLDVNGLVTVQDGRVVRGRVIRDRMGLWSRLRGAA